MPPPRIFHANGSDRAFTLIELSIVLVIIGLIVGGIMTGQQLIRQGALRAQIAQITNYTAAFNTFQVKYNCIPGDCTNITSFLGTVDPLGIAINNGNGNGQIDTSTGTSYETTSFLTWANQKEMWGALQQLSLSGLIKFTLKDTSATIGSSHPSATLNENTGFFFGASYNFSDSGGRFPSMDSYQTGTNALWFIHVLTTATSLDTWDNNRGIFPASDMQAMDSKIDDGKPLSGKLYGFSGGYSTPPGASHCLSASAYDTSYTSLQCQMVYVVN